eukprot:403365681
MYSMNTEMNLLPQPHHLQLNQANSSNYQPQPFHQRQLGHYQNNQSFEFDDLNLMIQNQTSQQLLNPNQLLMRHYQSQQQQLALQRSQRSQMESLRRQQEMEAESSNIMELDDNNRSHRIQKQSKSEDKKLQNKEKIMEACTSLIEKNAKQTIFSYAVTLVCLSAFIWMILLIKSNSEWVANEFVLVPIGLNSLQVIVLSWIQLKSNLYRHLISRQKENKILIFENILIISYLISLSLIKRFRDQGYLIPITASCFSLLLVLIQRFIWYKSVVKSFRTPVSFIKFVFLTFLFCLILNYNLENDEFFDFDIIVLLWPLYGLIAMTFIFFMGSLLLFIGSLCNSFQVQSSDQEYKLKIQAKVLKEKGLIQNIKQFEQRNKLLVERDQTFTCSVAFWILINCGYFLTFSVIGFLILLKEGRDGSDSISGMQKSYYVLIGYPIFISVFIVLQFQKISTWYYVKVLRPSIVNELISIEQQFLFEEQRQQNISKRNIQNLEFERRRQQVNNNDQENQSMDHSIVQLSQEDRQADHQREDLNEINKIQLLEDFPQHKDQILGGVPLFLVKISRSYFQKVEQYTNEFMTRVTSQIKHKVWRKQQNKDFPQNTNRKNFKGIKSKVKKGFKTNLEDTSYKTSKQRLAKYLENGKTIQQSSESIKLSIPDEKINDKDKSYIYKMKNQDSQIDELLLDDINFQKQANLLKESSQTEFDIEQNNSEIDYKPTESQNPYIKNTKHYDQDLLNRVCMTSQLIIETQSFKSNIPSESNTQRDKSQSNKKVEGQEQKQDKQSPQIRRRRRSFDCKYLLQRQENLNYIDKNVLKLEMLKNLKKLNKDLGYVYTESDGHRIQNHQSQNLTKDDLKKFAESGKEEIDVQIDENKFCMLCLERKSDAVILDCGHANICFYCAFKIYRTQKQCYLCRQLIDRIIKIERTEDRNQKYLKVIGIVQKIEGQFYYSDVSKDNVGEVRQLSKKPLQLQLQEDQEGEIETEFVNEGQGLNNNLSSQYQAEPHTAMQFKSQVINNSVNRNKKLNQSF